MEVLSFGAGKPTSSLVEIKRLPPPMPEPTTVAHA